MKLTKLKLKQLIKEELPKAQTRVNLEAANMLRKNPHTFKQFVKDNPEAGKYVASGVTGFVENAAVSPEAIKYFGAPEQATMAIYYLSEKEKAIAEAIDGLMQQPPFSAPSKQSSTRYIGKLFSTQIIDAALNQYMDNNREYNADIKHILSKEYLNPKALWRSYEKEQHHMRSPMRLYRYTADQIENITGKSIPGSTTSAVDSEDRLPDKNIYLYSYVMTDTQIEYTKKPQAESRKRSISRFKRLIKEELNQVLKEEAGFFDRMFGSDLQPGQRVAGEASTFRGMAESTILDALDSFRKSDWKGAVQNLESAASTIKEKIMTAKN